MTNSSSEKIKVKWTHFDEKKYTLRSTTEKNVKVPEKQVPKCLGFTFNGAKLLNMLPGNLREALNPNTFKTHSDKGMDLDKYPLTIITLIKFIF